MAQPGRDPTQPDDPGTGDRAILNEAKERFDRVREWESDFRALYIADVKFANGDPDNGWQWPDDIRGARGGTGSRDVNPRPCLTINKVAQLVLLITNDARQNKPAIKIAPTGEHDSFEAAEVFEGIIRYIERVSRAQTIYDEAVESQVEGGIAYWRVNTKFVDDDSFDQDLRIEPVRNHLNVYLDRDIKQKDGADAKYGFIFDEMPDKEAKKQFPDIDIVASSGFSETDDWVKSDNVRVAEYYRIREIEDELIYMEDGQNVGATFKRSEVPPQYREILAEAEKKELADPSKSYIKKRKIKRKQLEWFLIVGDTIVKRNLKLKGSYVPIIRLVGRERVIEGRLDRKGHVRPLKDPQRMYNYNSSGQVEFGALATKTPWVVAIAAMEGNQQAWFNANKQNAAVLPFRHKDEDGGAIPPPVRPDPPGTSPAFLEGMRIADAELMMASGQNPAQQGRPLQEKSGLAIQESQRQADTATYHFVDNLGIAIAHTGRVILDLIPHYYDTERVIQILAKDGSQKKVFVSPTATDPYKEQKEKDKVKAIFNPKVGKYDVEADIGPAYSSQRQAAWEAFLGIMQQAPQAAGLMMDIGFKSADFPHADEIGERFRRHLRATQPYLLDDGQPGPFIQGLQQQIIKLQQDTGKKDQTIAELLTNLAESNIKARGKDEKRDIEAYNAQTGRMKAEIDALAKVVLTPADHQRFEQKLTELAHSANLNIVTETNKAELANKFNGADEPDASGSGGNS